VGEDERGHYGSKGRPDPVRSLGAPDNSAAVTPEVHGQVSLGTPHPKYQVFRKDVRSAGMFGPLPQRSAREQKLREQPGWNERRAGAGKRRSNPTAMKFLRIVSARCVGVCSAGAMEGSRIGRRLSWNTGAGLLTSAWSLCSISNREGQLFFFAPPWRPRGAIHSLFSAVVLPLDCFYLQHAIELLTAPGPTLHRSFFAFKPFGLWKDWRGFVWFGMGFRFLGQYLRHPPAT